MNSWDQYLSIEEPNQLVNESGSEMGDSDLDEFVLEIDNNNSYVDVSGVVPNMYVSSAR